MRMQVERFGDFIAATRLPIATGTVRRFLDENAIDITETTDHFRDGSEIQRADGSTIEAAGPKPKPKPKRKGGIPLDELLAAHPTGDDRLG